VRFVQWSSPSIAEPHDAMGSLTATYQSLPIKPNALTSIRDRVMLEPRLVQENIELSRKDPGSGDGRVFKNTVAK
jgi:hypothetical protein